MTKRNQLALAIILVLLIIMVVIYSTFSALYGNSLSAANGIKEISDDLYTLSFKGDYGFEKLLQDGGCKDEEELSEFLISFFSEGSIATMAKKACTAIAVTTPSGGHALAHNFSSSHAPVMLIKTKPLDGYASVSATDLSVLGFTDESKPTSSLGARMTALASVYIPFDGMNEKGLMAALLSGDDDEAEDTEKPNLTATTALRMVLDYSATTEEAIESLRKFDVFPSGGKSYAMMVSDSGGTSAVIAWDDGEMEVAYDNVAVSEDGEGRLKIMRDGIHGGMETAEIMNLMKRAKEETLWSAAFEPETKRAHYTFMGSVYEMKL